MTPALVERVLDRVAERMSGQPAWEGVERADLLGTAGSALPTVSPAEDDFSRTWGRAALRDPAGSADRDRRDGEQMEFPGFGGAA